jgi:hypothetical protein
MHATDNVVEAVNRLSFCEIHRHIEDEIAFQGFQQRHIRGRLQTFDFANVFRQFLLGNGEIVLERHGRVRRESELRKPLLFRFADMLLQRGLAIAVEAVGVVIGGIVVQGLGGLKVKGLGVAPHRGLRLVWGY